MVSTALFVVVTWYPSRHGEVVCPPTHSPTGLSPVRGGANKPIRACFASGLKPVDQSHCDNMDKLQIVFVCLLLKLMFDPCSAQHPDCQLCPAGYYVTRNCSLEADGRRTGVQCAQCKDCSGEGQVMQTSCSWSSDSVCVEKPEMRVNMTEMPISLPDFPCEPWVIFLAIVSILMSLLFCLCLILYTCQNCTPHKGGLGEP
ncbi:uncharacterized protein LOC143003257 [Genypterus blacodes]|uniref:uncharacterized protein LOC143003257 n=1 Tax=Genypterus blacodes TaxID=154954 RepID=UPI003F766BE4